MFVEEKCAVDELVIVRSLEVTTLRYFDLCTPGIKGQLTRVNRLQSVVKLERGNWPLHLSYFESPSSCHTARSGLLAAKENCILEI